MDVPSYILDKNFFFIFHRGDPSDFSKKISQNIFLKNHKGPPYEKWKKYEFFFFNFFCPKCSLGHPKMPVRSFFEKSLTNFECVLFVRPRILTTSPFFGKYLKYTFYFRYIFIIQCGLLWTVKCQKRLIQHVFYVTLYTFKWFLLP